MRIVGRRHKLHGNGNHQVDFKKSMLLNYYLLGKRQKKFLSDNGLSEANVT